MGARPQEIYFRKAILVIIYVSTINFLLTHFFSELGLVLYDSPYCQGFSIGTIFPFHVWFTTCKVTFLLKVAKGKEGNVIDFYHC